MKILSSSSQNFQFEIKVKKEKMKLIQFGLLTSIAMGALSAYEVTTTDASQIQYLWKGLVVTYSALAAGFVVQWRKDNNALHSIIKSQKVN